APPPTTPLAVGEDFARPVHSDLAAPRLMAASQREAVGTQGGFSVPDELVAELLDASLEAEIVRPRAHVVPMLSKAKNIWAFDSSSAAGGILYGGLQPQWIAEEGTIPVTAGK